MSIRSARSIWVVPLLTLAVLGPLEAGAGEAPPAPALQATTLFGGGGGSPFEARGPGGALLVGVRTTTIVWAGHEVVRSLEPAFLVDGKPAWGPVFGQPNGAVRETLAKPGYAVGEMVVRVGHRVDGFQLVFYRIEGDDLIPYDGYGSPWIGGEGGSPRRFVGLGGARPVAGIFGRSGADLDAIGLLQPPLGNEPVCLTFSGSIDGSERIVIGAKEARWQNVFWGTSRSTVWLGGVAWTPSESPVLPNRGATAYLPAAVDFSTAKLVEKRGRDTVVVEPTASDVTVRIADSPNGSGLYEFTIAFERVHAFAQLSLHATIDGSDEITITAEKATWHHLHWGGPGPEVFLNDVAWDPARTPEISNEGPTRYLPPDVDFRQAHVVGCRGRDLAAVELAADHLTIHFVDTPIGSDVYEVVIAFGPVPGDTGSVPGGGSGGSPSAE